MSRNMGRHGEKQYHPPKPMAYGQLRRLRSQLEEIIKRADMRYTSFANSTLETMNLKPSHVHEVTERNMTEFIKGRTKQHRGMLVHSIESVLFEIEEKLGERPVCVFCNDKPASETVEPGADEEPTHCKRCVGWTRQLNMK